MAIDPTPIVDRLLTVGLRPDWQSPCGRVALFHRDAWLLLDALPPGTIDAVVADAPYSSGGFTRGDRMQRTALKYTDGKEKCEIPDFTGDNRDQRSYLAWLTLWLTAARQAAVPGALASLFTDWRQLPVTTDALQCAGWMWRGIATWAKTNSRPQLGRYGQHCEFVPWATNGPREIAGRTSIGYMVADSPRERIHQTQKPVGVMEWLLEPIADGATITDPFLGSGTTAVAALRRGYQFIGSELDPVHFASCVARLEEELGRLALFERETQTELFADAG